MNLVTQFYQEIEPLLKKGHGNQRAVKLIIASKYFNSDQIMKLYKMGQRDFGENKVQDALEKMGKLPKDICWHFIGHLQKNKMNKIVDLFDLIHSVDSVELAQKISKKSSKVQKILLQINASNEASKRGFSVEEFLEKYLEIEKLENIELCGLMTMAALSDDPQKTSDTFQVLAKLRKKLNKESWKLSMGMSTDYAIAIQNDADLIRIGRRFLEGL
ncbi:MAG: Pyridoxal phosphate homeostasis protein [Chlamydiae bacterium]|nr:Pyridoxal phosphate homeostasis protein [Chlamydiota bacterium]